MLQGRRPYVVVALVLLSLVALAFYSWLTSPTPIAYYRLVDDQTLALGIDDSGNVSNHLGGLDEAPDKVTVTVIALQLTIGPSGRGAVPAEVEAHLSQPLGDRTVIDGKTGKPVQRRTCAPPFLSSTPCTEPSASPFTDR